MDPKTADLYIPSIIAVQIIQEGDPIPDGWRITPTHIPGLNLAHKLTGGSYEKPDSGRQETRFNESTCPNFGQWAQFLPKGQAA